MAVRSTDELQADMSRYSELSRACVAIKEFSAAFAYRVMARKCWNTIKEINHEEEGYHG